MKTLRTVTLLLAWALPGASMAGSNGPCVVELFTSQGCYSCPPAERFLGELVNDHPDVLALEFHVDYWNDLVYGSAGRWQDPFSSGDFTSRQRAYSQQPLAGRKGVYTPQVVVDGRFAAVGTQQSQILSYVRKRDEFPMTISVAGSSEGILDVELSGRPDAAATLWLVRFDRKHVTEVTSGENKGKTLTNYNVVTQMQRIGELADTDGSFTVDIGAVGSDEGCALLVQSAAPGPVLAAVRCPET